jgi:hypothetical protein
MKNPGSSSILPCAFCNPRPQEGALLIVTFAGRKHPPRTRPPFHKCAGVVECGSRAAFAFNTGTRSPPHLFRRIQHLVGVPHLCGSNFPGIRISDFPNAPMPSRLPQIVEFPLWQSRPICGKSSTVLAQIQRAQYRKHSRYLKYPSLSPCGCGRYAPVNERVRIQPLFSLAGPPPDGRRSLGEVGQCQSGRTKLCQNRAKTVPDRPPVTRHASRSR